MKPDIKSRSPALSELHQAARDYAEAGTPIFPCHANSKKPACEHGFKDATTDLDQIDWWWTENPHYNLAMCPEDTQSCVIDVEFDGGGDLAKLQAEHGKLPRTYTVRTPRGGWHYVFDGSLPSMVRPFQGMAIDTRGRGGYVMLEPSIVDGKPYTVIDDNGFVSARVPEWLVEALRQPERAVSTPDIGLDARGNVAAAVAFLNAEVRTGNLAIEGEGGDQRTYTTAATVLDFGLSEAKCLEIMLQHWNPKCLPPWSEDGLGLKIANAIEYRQNKGAPLAVAPAAEVFADVVAKFPTDAPANGKRSRFYPVGESEMDNQAPTQWLIPELIQDARTVLLVGETQSYKSFLALDIALSVAAGVEFAGHVPLKPGPTFYAALEGLHDIKGARRKAWRIARGIDSERELPFYALPAPQVSSNAECQEFMGQIAERCKDGPAPRLIVLETLNKIMAGLDENGSKDAGLLIALADGLCERFGCGVLVIHHKSDKNGADVVRGSSALRAGFDTLLEADADRSIKTLRVRVHKHKDAPERDQPFTFLARSIAASLVLEPAAAADVKKRMMDADPFHPSNVGAALKQLGAAGVDNAVSSYALASHMVTIGEGEAVEKHQKRVMQAKWKLNRRASDGLAGYSEKDEKGEWKWFLPTGENH